MNRRAFSQGRPIGTPWFFPLTIIGSLCLLLATSPIVSAQTTPPRPGATDPAKNFSEWPDDEIFVTTPVLTDEANASYAKLIEMSGDLLAIDGEDSTPTGLIDGVDAVSAHFLAAEHESIVLAYRSGSAVEVRISDVISPSAVLPNLLNRHVCSTDYFDVAYGDLDGLPAGWPPERRDEIVVAYATESASAPYPIRLAVVNFGRTSAVSPATVVTTAIAPAGASLGAIDICQPPRYNVVAVAAGDFDGNGVQEIAVATMVAPDRLNIAVFRYSATRNPTTGEIQAALKVLGQSSVQVSDAVFTSLSAVTGDFDGDGRDELALATAHHTSLNHRVVTARIFRIAGDPYLTPSLVRDVVLSNVAKNSTAGRVEIATGLFKVNLADPTQGWTTNRRQLAVAYRGESVVDTGLVDATVALQVKTISLEKDLTAKVSLAWTSPGHDPHGGFWLTAGGFRGLQDKSNPTWSLALTTWDQASWGLTVLQPGAGDAAPAQKFAGQRATPETQHILAPPRLALAAADPDGDTVYLGAPVHFTIDNLVSTDFVLQEPPKHAYWDRDANPPLQNVSRVDNINVQLISEEKATFNATREDTADYAIGGSLSASVSGTATAGANIGIAKASAAVSTTVSARLGYDFELNKSSYESAYGSIETGYSGTTNRDDYIVARTQLLDVWRYRVFGLSEPDPGDPTQTIYPYFDIVLPGPYGYLESSGSALNFDWYQPTHENGNILSYPRYNTQETLNPADLGFFTVPPDPQIRSGMLYPPVQKFCDQDSSANYLKFSTESGGGTSRSYSHTLDASASVQSQATVTASAFGSSLGASASYGVELHGSTSWGRVATSSNTTSASTGITLNQVPSCFGGRQAYAFYPLIYTASDGTIKVSFAVNPTGSAQGSTFWRSYYSLPDLALNLPKRFIPVGDGVFVPEVGSQRNEIRGFFVRTAEIDPATGDYALLSGPVVDGTNVRLEARVYNYSVQGTVPAGSQACFSYVPFDSANFVEGSVRKPILPCAVLTQQLLPQQMATAAVVWDTTGLSAAGAHQDYRIYVNLIPPAGVTEKYPPETKATRTYCGTDPAKPTVQVCVDPGQNNEGWRLVTVAPPPKLGAPGGEKPPAHIGMMEDAVAAINRKGEIVTGNVQAYLNQPLMVRITVHSDTTSTAYGTVLVYDGDPNQGGELIAGKRVFIGSDDPAGASVWFGWVPTTKGPHRLYAKLLQSVDDSAPGGNIGMLKVEVIPVPGGRTK